MGLFSLFRKNKQKPGSEQSAYHSRAADDTSAIRASRKRKTVPNQTNDPADPVLPEKKRARRRLVGAVALVLAVVIVLPMVLDSEPKPLVSDISIQIPPRDQPASASASGSASTSASASVPNAANAGSGLDKQEEIIEPASPSESSPISSGQPQSAGKSAAGASPIAPVAPIATATPVTPSLPSTDSASPSDSAGSLSPTPPEAKVVTQPKVENKPKAEVREERKSRSEPKLEAKAEERPATNASQDDSARAAAILNGGSPAPSVEKKQGKFVIQVAALASQDKVDELQGKLNDAGIRSYTQKVKTSAGERIRIRVGPFASKEEAEKARARLAPLGLSGSLVPA
ncbi:SPOR domain-containing protein [Glaciimonas sp. PAMC28666]|uniref:SPOR domain-containing protein n=1 Tax=Glaciimonas sp. PAMC28666 TaxID=2807626 RepID=UPI001962642C|nr:SPOR domain-containing protein [Glaciimonas sp. PAMC28666]QRX82559.1 SPOR domain-containing protein [Glaciimonas sp. PAMC28666]